MKLFLCATLAIMLGIMGQIPRIQAQASLALGSNDISDIFSSLSNLAASNVIDIGANIFGGGVNLANAGQIIADLDSIYKKLNIEKGNKIIIGVDSLKNLRPDASGNVDIGSFLEHFGISSGKHMISSSIIQNLPSDASGKIDLLTLLEKLNIGFCYGGPNNGKTSEPFQINVDDLYKKLGYSRGSTVTLGTDNLKNLRPDTYGNVDVGPYLMPLGIGNGSYIVKYDVIKNLPTDSAGKMDLLTLLGKLNIGYSYGNSLSNEKLVVNLDELYKKLGYSKGSIITLKVDSLRTLKPDSNGNVDVGPMLQPLGIGSGSYLVNSDVVKNLPTNAEGKIDLLTLLKNFNITFNYGGAESSQPLDPINLDELYKTLGYSKGSTINLKVDSLKNLIPDSNGNVDVGSVLQPLGIGSGSYLINHDIVKNLPTNTEGKMDLLTLLDKLNIKFNYGSPESSKPMDPINVDQLFSKLGYSKGSTVTLNVSNLKNLKPDSNGNVDVGPYLQPLGIGNGSYLVKSDIVKNLPTDAEGKMDLLTMLEKFNIRFNYGDNSSTPSEPLVIDIDNLYAKLGSEKGSTIMLKVDGLKTLKPDSNGNVDVGPYLQPLGIGNGSYLVNSDNVKNLPTNSEGKMDLLSLLEKLNIGFNYGGSNPTEASQPLNVNLDDLYAKLGYQKGSTITLKVDSFKNLRPDSNGKVDVGPMLKPLGIGSGSVLVDSNIVKNLPTDAEGKMDLLSLLENFKIPFNYGGSSGSQPIAPINVDQLFSKLGYSKGSTVTLKVDSLKALKPDSNGNVDVGPYLQPLGIGNGSYLVQSDIVKNLPTDWEGKMDLLTMLEKFNIGFNYGDNSSTPSEPLVIDIDNLYAKLGSEKGSTIMLKVDGLKTLKPDSNGNVDVGPYLQPLGIGNGSYLVNSDNVKNLPTNSEGKMDLLSLLEKLNIGFNYGGSNPTEASQPLNVNLDDLYAKLGYQKGSTITLKVDSFKNLRPDSNGKVDVGPMLKPLGIGSGSVLVDSNIVKNLPTDAEGKMDLLSLLENFKIPFNYGGSSGSQPIAPINVDQLFSKLGYSKGSTVTLKVDSLKALKPDSNGNVDVGPYLQPLGIGNGSYLVKSDVLKNLPTDAEGKMDLLTMLENFDIGFNYGDNSSTPSEPLVIDIDNLYAKLGSEKGSTIMLKVDGLKTLKPDSNGNVDVGPYLQPLGIGNGSYLVNSDNVKNLPTNTEGKMDLLSFLEKLNIGFNYGGSNPTDASQPLNVNLDDLYAKLGYQKGSTITLKVDSLKNLRPDSNGKVDVGPMLKPLGIGSGSVLVDSNVVKNLPTDAEGRIDLLSLLENFKIPFNYGGSSGSQPIAPINVDQLFSKLGYSKGSTVTLKVDSLKALKPDSNGNVDVGPYLQPLGIGNGSYLVKSDIVKNLPTDWEGKMDLLTMLEKFNIGFNYGDTSSAKPAQPLVIDIDSLYAKLGADKDSTIMLKVDGLKTLKPDSNGNVDVGPYLQPLGIGDGSYVISSNIVKNLPTNAEGKMDLLSLLQQLNISYNNGDSKPTSTNLPTSTNSPTSTLSINIDDLYKRLGFSKDSSLILSVDSLKALTPDSNGNVDVRPFLQVLGIDSGPYPININIIKNLPTDANGKIDLLTLLGKFNITFNHGPDGGSAPGSVVVRMDDVYTKFGLPKGSPIILSADSLKLLTPDAYGKVDIGPFVKQLGVDVSSYPVSSDIIKNLPVDATGKIDLPTLLEKCNIGFIYGNGNPASQQSITVNANDIYKKFNIDQGTTINLSVDPLKSLKPDSAGNVDVGPFLQVLGIGNGSYLVSSNSVKNLATDASGKMDLLTLLGKLNITVTGIVAAEPPKTNASDVIRLLGQLSGRIDMSGLKSLQPNYNNEVDIGPWLQKLGVGNGAAFPVSYDAIKNL